MKRPPPDRDWQIPTRCFDSQRLIRWARAVSISPERPTFSSIPPEAEAAIVGGTQAAPPEDEPDDTSTDHD
ncbi:MAG: hypothetical protein U0235_31350 [Polyangiaceae bacterium]